MPPVHVYGVMHRHRGSLPFTVHKYST